MQVKDDGESECLFVTNKIEVTASSRKAAYFRRVSSYEKFIRRLLIRQSKWCTYH